MKFNKENFTNSIKDLQIWKLIELLHYLNKRIILLKKSGESTSKSRPIRKLNYKRNMALDILTEKLLLWREDKNNSKYSIGGFADIKDINFEDIEMEIEE